jgi:hypothetical protein
MRVEAEARTLTDTRRRSAAELAKWRGKLQALWSARVRQRSWAALRASAALAAIAGILYVASIAFQSAEAPPAPSIAAPASLKLDYQLHTRPLRAEPRR